MATWQKFLRCDDMFLQMDEVTLDVYSVFVGGRGERWKYNLKVNHTPMSSDDTFVTAHEAQLAAINDIIAKLDAWKAQAQAARDELTKGVQ